MRRRVIITAILCLLLGAAINIAVAWGCTWIRLHPWDFQAQLVTPELPPWNMTLVMRRAGAVLVQNTMVGIGELEASLDPASQIDRVAQLREQATTYPAWLPNPTTGGDAHANALGAIVTVDARGWPFPALCRRVHGDLSVTLDKSKAQLDVKQRMTQWNDATLELLRTQRDRAQQASWRGEVFWRGFILNTLAYAVAAAIGVLFLRLMLITLSGWRARSRLVLASIALTAGAASTIAVAWSFAAWGEFTKRGMFGHMSSLSYVDIDSSRSFPGPGMVVKSVSVDDGVGLTMIQSSVARAFGPMNLKRQEVAAEDLIPSWAEFFLKTPLDTSLADTPRDRRFAASSGWPMFAMYTLWLSEAETGVVAPPGWPKPSSREVSSRAISGIPLESTVASNRLISTTQLPRALPLGIIWPGFIIDTMLYAFMWFVLIVLALSAFTLRGRLRQRRGCCRRCGYDLRGRGAEHEVCPECGTAPVFATKSSR